MKISVEVGRDLLMLGENEPDRYTWRAVALAVGAEARLDSVEALGSLSSVCRSTGLLNSSWS